MASPSGSTSARPLDLRDGGRRGQNHETRPLSEHEHRAEADAVRHDLPERLLGLIEPEPLDPRPDPRERAEGDGLLGVDRPAARPAGDGLAGEERERRELERLERRRDDEQLAPGLEAVHGARDRSAVRRGREDEIGPAQPLQALGRVDVLRVDVLASASLSAPREIATVRNPIRAAYWIAR